ALLGSGVAGCPVAARAQHVGKIPRIGIIDDAPRWNAFRHGLRGLGYLEGQNVAFEYAYGDGVPERLAEAAAVLVHRLLRGRTLRSNTAGRTIKERNCRHWRLISFAVIAP